MSGTHRAREPYAVRLLFDHGTIVVAEPPDVHSGGAFRGSHRGGTRASKYGSKLEERFARDFGRVALDWHLVREPIAIDVFGTLTFPDFELRHRRDEKRAWLVEIVGFWTPQYVARKLDVLRKAEIRNLILCIDAGRCCADGDLPAGAHVVRYRRRIDPHDILAIIEPGT